MIQPNTLLNLPQGAGQPQFSPDVALIAYVENGSVWVTTVAAGGVAVKVGRGANPQWHPDGWLSFLREQEGVTRVWRYDVTSEAGPKPLPPADLSVGAYAWSPDGLRLAVFEGRVLQRPQVARPGAIWLLEAESGETMQRIDPPPEPQLLLSGPVWSPDSQRIVWSSAVSAPGDWLDRHEVRMLRLGEDAIQSVIPVGACQTSRPAWRGDGQALAFAATPHPYGFNALFNLATWNLKDTSVRYRTHEPFTLLRGGSPPVWSSDGQTIYVSGNNGTITRHLFAVSLKDGAARALTHGLSNHKTPMISNGGRWLACTMEAPDRLTEISLVATDGSEARPLTQANCQLDTIAGVDQLEVEAICWRSFDGLEVEGLLFYPPGCGPDRPPQTPLPTIVDLHGGPTGRTPNRLLGDDPLFFTGLHWLAAHGYLCFASDYRSSGVYGWRHFQRMIDTGHDFNLRPDVADIMAGVDYVVATGLADPARLGLRGHSAGAILTNWLITQTNRFAAAVSVEGLTDFVSATNATSPNSGAELAFGGSVDEVPENYRAFSPLTYAAQARTPLLLCEGEHMARMQQGKPFCDALEVAGVEVDYVHYAGEGHKFRQPENQADYMRRMLAWFDRHLRDT